MNTKLLLVLSMLFFVLPSFSFVLPFSFFVIPVPYRVRDELPSVSGDPVCHTGESRYPVTFKAFLDSGLRRNDGTMNSWILVSGESPRRPGHARNDTAESSVSPVVYAVQGILLNRFDFPPKKRAPGGALNSGYVRSNGYGQATPVH